MTVNGLKGHFTLYVHYYELPLTNYLLLIYCTLFITRVTNAREKCGKRTLVSGDIKLCGYSQGFSGEGASNDSGVIENVDFQRFWTAFDGFYISSFYQLF